MNLPCSGAYGLLTIVSQDKMITFFAIITLQITKKINSESLGDLYSLVYQIFGKKKERND